MNLLRCSVAILAVTLAAPARSQTVHQITDFPVDRLGEFALDDAGNVVVAVTTADPFGANPDHEFQAVSWTGTGAGSPLTRFGGLLTTISVSDDGQWIAFASVADPLGENQSRDRVAFLQSADGSVLRQLGPGGGLVRISGSGNRVVAGGSVIDLASNTVTPVGARGDSVSMTDDGNVVAYSSEGRVYRVHADGSGLVQLTPSDIEDATGAIVSGDGQRVTYESGGQIYVIAADGGEPFLIGPGSHPSISDDGAWVYYSASDGDNVEIYRSWVENPTPQPLTRTSPPLSNDWPQVSGSGDRVAFVRYGTVASDPVARVLMVMNSTGGAVEQLGTAETDWSSREPDITSDGERVVFLGGSRDVYDVCRVQADGTDLVEITHGVEALHPSVADDGETIVFQSSLDLTGDNPCGTAQVFRVNAEGSGLAQLSPSGSCSVHEYPVISRDGSTVVYQQDGTQLFAVPAAGGAATMIAVDSSVYPKIPRISGNGRLVVYQAHYQTFLARTDGSGTQAIGGYPLSSYFSDISADGSRVAYSELGFNPDDFEYSAVWLYESETGLHRRISWDDALLLRISGDGEYVYYFVLYGDWNNGLRQLRISTAESKIFHGLRDLRVAPSTFPTFAVDGVGRVAVSGPINWTDENPDLNEEIWLVDFRGTPRWDIEDATPARVRFSPDPFGTAYDLVRGDVGNLGFGLDDSVDLGEVTCLANDSPTSSAVDLEGPEPNQAFFYLFRATGGSDWGASSSGAPRVPGAGGCP